MTAENALLGRSSHPWSSTERQLLECKLPIQITGVVSFAGHRAVEEGWLLQPIFHCTTNSITCPFCMGDSREVPLSSYTKVFLGFLSVLVLDLQGPFVYCPARVDSQNKVLIAHVLRSKLKYVQSSDTMVSHEMTSTFFPIQLLATIENGHGW